MPHLGAAEMRVLHDGDLVGQLREQPDGPVQDVVEVVGPSSRAWMARRSAGESGLTAEIWSTKSR